MLVGNISTHSINPILFAKRTKIDAPRDLAPVTKLVAIPNFIPGSPRLPAKTLKDALADPRDRPGQLKRRDAVRMAGQWCRIMRAPQTV